MTSATVPSSSATVRVPAKVNLELLVGPLRDDGYHNLSTVYHAVSLFDEVTVSFDHYHAHFERWGVRERGMEHEAASTLVYALLGDELVVASGWDGERWCGSCELAAHEELDPAFLNGATRLRIRSWSGKLDADRDLGSAA